VPDHRVRPVRVPWTEARSRFTLLAKTKYFWLFNGEHVPEHRAEAFAYQFDGRMAIGTRSTQSDPLGLSLGEAAKRAVTFASMGHVACIGRCTTGQS
jgi:hypothetical protein